MRQFHVVAWLAWKEYRRCFFRPPGTHRDFLWLTILIGMLTALGLLLQSANTGLLQRYADSLLGYVDGYGFPVMVRAEIGHTTRVNRSLVMDHRLYPFLEVDQISGLRPILSFDDPDDSASTAKGWAVYHDDPLWQWAHKEAGTPLDGADFSMRIVLTRNAFKRFDYSRYKSAVLAEVPEPVALPTFTPNSTQLTVFWMYFERTGPVPFRIVWVDNIPSPVALAFLLPMDTLHLAEALRHLPSLDYYPSMDGDTDPKLQAVRLWPVEGNQDLAAQFTAKLYECLKPIGLRREGNSLAFGRYPPLSWVNKCASNIGLPSSVEIKQEPYQADSVTRSDAIRERGILRVPCKSLQPMDRIKPENEVACGGNDTAESMGRYDALLADYKGGLQYNPERGKISDTANSLEGVKDHDNKVFRLDPTYEMSLNRVQYLSDVTDAASVWILIASALFGTYLLTHALQLVIEHRSVYYGTLMANGITIPALHAMLLLEIALAWLFGGIVFGVGMELLKQIINFRFAYSALAREGRETLAITRTDILPHTDLPVFLMIWCGTFAVAAIISLLLGWRHFPKNNEAAALMQD